MHGRGPNIERGRERDKERQRESEGGVFCTKHVTTLGYHKKGNRRMLSVRHQSSGGDLSLSSWFLNGGHETHENKSRKTQVAVGTRSTYMVQRTNAHRESCARQKRERKSSHGQANHARETTALHSDVVA